MNKENVSRPKSIPLLEDLEGNKTVPLDMVLEGILYVTSKPIKISEIRRGLIGISRKQIEEAMKYLKERLERTGSAFELIHYKDGDKYLMKLKPEIENHLDTFMTKKSILSKALLKTLGLIAVRQPMKQSDLALLRGSQVYDQIKELEAMNFIKSEKRGRTKILYTTPYFAEFFGLPSDIKEMKEYLSKKTSLADDEEDELPREDSNASEKSGST